MVKEQCEIKKSWWVVAKSLLIWLTIIPCAVLNGELREKVLRSLLNEQWVLPTSGLLLAGGIFLLTWWLLPKLGKQKRQLFGLISCVWLVFTLLFETIMGLSMGVGWQKLLENYDLTTGNLWVLIVLFVGIVPSWVAKKRKLII